MKNYIVLFREPDGRTIQHSNEELHQHQTSWKNWLEIWGKEGKLNGGSSLTLTGRIIRGKDRKTTNDIHKVGTDPNSMIYFDKKLLNFYK